MRPDDPRQAIIRRLCLLQRLICDEAIGYSEPNDCFCLQENAGDELREVGPHWQHSGRTVEFIEQAVHEKIARDKRGADVAHDSFVEAVVAAMAKLCVQERIDPQAIARQLSAGAEQEVPF